jgi:hypothetical protein
MIAPRDPFSRIAAAMQAVFAIAELTSTQKLVALAVLSRADVGGRVVVAMRWLAEDAGLNRRTVIGAVKALEAAGVVTVVRRGGPDSGQQPNEYAVRVPPPHDDADEAAEAGGPGGAVVVSASRWLARPGDRVLVDGHAALRPLGQEQQSRCALCTHEAHSGDCDAVARMFACLSGTGLHAPDVRAGGQPR